MILCSVWQIYLKVTKPWASDFIKCVVFPVLAKAFFFMVGLRFNKKCSGSYINFKNEQNIRDG